MQAKPHFWTKLESKNCFRQGASNFKCIMRQWFIALALTGLATPLPISELSNATNRLGTRMLLSGATFTAVPRPTMPADRLEDELQTALVNDNERGVVCLCMANRIELALVDKLPWAPNAATVHLLVGFPDAFAFAQLEPLVRAPATAHFALALAECVSAHTEHEYAQFLHERIGEIIPQLASIHPSFSDSVMLPARALQRHGYASSARALLLAATRAYTRSQALGVLYTCLEGGVAPDFALHPDAIAILGRANIVSALLAALYLGKDTHPAAILAAIRAAVAESNEPGVTAAAGCHTADIVFDLVHAGRAHRAALLCALLPVRDVEQHIPSATITEDTLRSAMSMTARIARMDRVRRMLFFNPAKRLITMSHLDESLIECYREYAPYTGEPSAWPCH